MIGARRLTRKSAKSEASTTKSAWNSLEFAKLIVGVLTPLALAVIGISVSFSQKESDRRHAEWLQEQAENRERRSRSDAELREMKKALAAEIKTEREREADAKQRRLDSQAQAARDKAVRDEAFIRQLAIQAQADEREERRLQAATARERADRTHINRIAMWDRASSVISKMNELGSEYYTSLLNSRPLRLGVPKEYHDTTAELLQIANVQGAIFPEELSLLLQRTAASARTLRFYMENYEERDAIEDYFDKAKTSVEDFNGYYEQLISEARDKLYTSQPVLPTNSAQAKP